MLSCKKLIFIFEKCDYSPKCVNVFEEEGSCQVGSSPDCNVDLVPGLPTCWDWKSGFGCSPIPTYIFILYYETDFVLLV